MTYNATTPKLRAAVACGLVIHQPLFDIGEHRRTILLPPALKRQLRNEDAAPFSALSLALPLGRFVAGQSFSVSQKYRPDRLFRKSPKPDLERLEGIEEVWALCHRTPKPGWRLMGRFLEKDAFVLLRVMDRIEIGNDYAAAAALVSSDWNNYFPNMSAHSGNWIDSYISGTHYDLDEDKEIGSA